MVDSFPKLGRSAEGDESPLMVRVFRWTMLDGTPTGAQLACDLLQMTAMRHLISLQNAAITGAVDTAAATGWPRRTAPTE